MAKTILINAGNLDQARSFLTENLKRDGKDMMNTCLMICEETIVRLLDSGNKEVSVCVRGFFSPHVEILSELPMDDYYNVSNKSEEERFESEIRRDLLSQYEAYIDQEMISDRFCYRIYMNRRGGEVLKEQIFSFYSRDSRGEKRKPSDILRYLAGKHRTMVVLSVVNRTVKHVCALLLPVFAAGLIDTLTKCDSFFEGPVLFNILGSVISLVINLICATLDARVYQRFVRGVESGFKMAIVQKLQVLSMKFYNSTPSGKLLSKLVSDVQFIKMMLCEQMQTVLHLCIDIVFVSITSLIRLPIMLLFYAIAIPASALIIRHYMRPIRISRSNMRKKTEVVNASVKEMLAMENLSRAHGVQESGYRDISVKVSSVEGASVEQDRLQVHLNNAAYATSQGFRLICVVVAVFLAFKGKINVASVVLFASLFDALNNSVQKFLDDIPQITQELESLASVDELLGEEDIEKNGSEQLPLPVRGEIRFEDVTFTYSPDQPPTLSHANIEIPAGKSVAFIGKSGAGKSTVLSIILGLYSPQSGKITVDGLDLDKIDKLRYRKHIAVVPQHSLLFSGSLWDNLVYGLKYVSEERVLEALDSVGLLELVTGHPDGLFRPIAEGGENLSGGQRQRISIARALIRDPSIILFDEATSALDVESEKEVQEAIESILGKCTVVMVAHRLYTLRKADIMYKIEDGLVKRCEFAEATEAAEDIF